MNAKTSGVAESNQVDGTCSKRRVLVVDDHPVVRERLSELIGMEPDLLPCGEAEDAAGALEAIEQTRPDIVIVDLSLKNSCGLELIKDIHIRWPRMPTLVLSVHDEAFYAERAIHAGAKGYVTKHEASRNILTAIHKVLDGDIYVSDKLASKLLRRVAGDREQSDGSPLAKLSDRELEVFEMLGQGKGVRQIAQMLHISPKTVGAHREHIKAKLNLGGTAELLRYAIQSQLQPEATE